MLATPSRFTSGQELPALQAIERFIGQKIPRLKLENFPYLYTALFESESARAAVAQSAGAEPIADIHSGDEGNTTFLEVDRLLRAMPS